MPLPPDHDQRMARARLSLDGLSIGDAFGQEFFRWDMPIDELVSERVLPRGPWYWTDDTTCAIVGSIVSMAVGEEGIPKEWWAAREPLSL